LALVFWHFSVWFNFWRNMFILLLWIIPMENFFCCKRQLKYVRFFTEEMWGDTKSIIFQVVSETILFCAIIHPTPMKKAGKGPWTSHPTCSHPCQV
jgi:hypothetical protein